MAEHEESPAYISKRREELRQAMKEKYPKTKESMHKIGSTGRSESDEDYWSGRDHS